MRLGLLSLQDRSLRRELCAAGVGFAPGARGYVPLLGLHSFTLVAQAGFSSAHAGNGDR